MFYKPIYRKSNYRVKEKFAWLPTQAYEKLNDDSGQPGKWVHIWFKPYYIIQQQKKSLFGDMTWAYKTGDYLHKADAEATMATIIDNKNV